MEAIQNPPFVTSNFPLIQSDLLQFDGPQKTKKYSSETA